MIFTGLELGVGLTFGGFIVNVEIGTPAKWKADDFTMQYDQTRPRARWSAQRLPGHKLVIEASCPKPRLGVSSFLPMTVSGRS